MVYEMVAGEIGPSVKRATVGVTKTGGRGGGAQAWQKPAAAPLPDEKPF